DLGTRTGWALRTRDGLINGGSELFRRAASKAAACAICASSAGSPSLKRCADGLDLVVFESVRRHAGVDAAHAYGEVGQLTAWCEDHQIPYQGVPVGTIKKHATGKGNANKQAMIAAAQARGLTPVDDNHADALALLDWALAQEVAP
ncbi:hypothetical protein U5801_27595, partial [Lamprobacter modestohalophilus]|uniref:hypothetical protein n=1 Tax=Lamprobacter modestohalophilus TaxID=1064514 RepID=UPI002ADEA9F3